ncbi:30S ribosomal protein S3 [archaeon HR05]|jgi:small subunit ribosomal protein S3|uniref:Small ribosomal subunit protein uS3 n=2 Tax=Candidatus Nitrosocaldaceae TaxID=1968910 RepID=A0A2K5AQV1_9ARCH|nr:30S ribosomal protein S3 [archaeon HR05]SPC34005.1 30S ribosomal protein S3p [Candidatus Nitrosocaldus cavascurensis]
MGMSKQEYSSTKAIMKNFFRNSELDEFLEKELAHAGYGGAEIQKTPLGTRITVYVTRPGLIIGRKGFGIKELTSKLEKEFGLENPQISVLEIEVPELNPRIIANRVAQMISKGTAFRRAALWALNTIMDAGAMGAEVVISGKLRSERASFEKYTAGILPKSGEPAERAVKEAVAHVLLKMGLYGIHIKIAYKDALPAEFELRDSGDVSKVEVEQDLNVQEKKMVAEEKEREGDVE